MILRSLLIAAVLAAINVGSIIVGFVAFKASGAANQLAVQLPTAVTFCVGGFTVWCIIAAHLPWLRDGMWSTPAAAVSYVGAILFGSMLFAALHYASQGYVTSPANLAALLCFQIPVNLLVLWWGPALSTHFWPPPRTDPCDDGDR